MVGRLPLNTERSRNKKEFSRIFKIVQLFLKTLSASNQDIWSLLNSYFLSNCHLAEFIQIANWKKVIIPEDTVREIFQNAWSESFGET